VLLVPQDPLVLRAIRAILVLLDPQALLGQLDPKDPKDRKVSKVKKATKGTRATQEILDPKVFKANRVFRVSRVSKAKLDPKDRKVKLGLQVLQVRLVPQVQQALLDHRAKQDHKAHPPKVDLARFYLSNGRQPDLRRVRLRVHETEGR
jgi:hypothetical protein